MWRGLTDIYRQTQFKKYYGSNYGKYYGSNYVKYYGYNYGKYYGSNYVKYYGSTYNTILELKAVLFLKRTHRFQTKSQLANGPMKTVLRNTHR